MQAVHVSDEPAAVRLLNVPTVQPVHTEGLLAAGMSLYVPAAHGAHGPEEADNLKVPALHEVHPEVPLAMSL